MHVTRHSEAVPYDAGGHFKMTGLRLQGYGVSPTKSFWVGLSHFLPAGGAESSASNSDKVYVVLRGKITVITDLGETTLNELDSCFLAAGERRSIANKTNSPASMLVIMSYP